MSSTRTPAPQCTNGPCHDRPRYPSDRHRSPVLEPSRNPCGTITFALFSRSDNELGGRCSELEPGVACAASVSKGPRLATRELQTRSWRQTAAESVPDESDRADVDRRCVTNKFQQLCARVGSQPPNKALWEASTRRFSRVIAVAARSRMSTLFPSPDAPDAPHPRLLMSPPSLIRTSPATRDRRHAGVTGGADLRSCP
jgi:hypothetical protein